MKAKMDFCAHCVANILQNVSNGQKITQKHICYAMQTAFLTFYPGKTMWGTSRFHLPLGHFSHSFVYCIKGLPGGKASVVWCIDFYIDTTSAQIEVCNGQYGSSAIKYLTGVDPSQIYNKLEIKEGEMKILLECAMMYGASKDRYFSDGRSCAQVSVREAFGFLLRSPKMLSTNCFFHGIMIFTPKPGLFDEIVPSA
ncbi:MAG: hypothetical protein LBJ71_03475 [Holosporaceae bacterium]|jgi:hypothetical protein|nr:hypothetical protein [Holosporaceae bacterium]